MILIARSARWLAEAAAAVGCRALLLDAYNDSDGLAASQAMIPMDNDRHWAPSTVLARLGDWRGVPVVYGAGLEGRIELLEALAREHPIIGNAPAVLAAITDPATWFAALSQLGIAHPETQFKAPTAELQQKTAWLAKRARSAGGQQVVFADHAVVTPDTYWQRRLQGHSCSVWFIADGARARILGGVRHLQLQPTRAWPFRMSGAVRLPLPAMLREALAHSIDRLVDHFGLRGLNGLDFILTSDAGVGVLEINARPPSTLALMPERPWFDWHLTAGAGRWVEINEDLQRGSPAAAQAVVYCPHELALMHRLPALAWLHDRAPASRRVVWGEPCFTVSARAPTPSAAVQLLRARVTHVLRACLQPLSV